MRRFLSLLACLVAVSGSAVAGVSAAHADIADTDAAYCPYGLVNGVGTWTPPERANLEPHTFTWTTNAQCSGAGDENGVYAIAFVGVANDNCAVGMGDGVLNGAGPEGSISGSFTFYRGGVHLYISGNFTSGGEQHILQYWLDVVAAPTEACDYSTAALIGHGVIADNGNPGSRASV